MKVKAVIGFDVWPMPYISRQCAASRVYEIPQKAKYFENSSLR